MPDNPRVKQLLEELLDSGGTPEEVCETCPELLPQVRAGWQRLRALKAEVGEWFPASPILASAAPTPQSTADLPHINGYDVQVVLGRGGCGIVYKAWHQRLNRSVALKMLLAGSYARMEELERFLREAEAVAGLRHANIVQVYDMGDLDGRPYFTMEYVEGGNLAEKLAGTPQPAYQAAALVATIAEAIEVAHQSGIVHRDLKPANILLTADGTPKVTDFGLARRLDSGAALTVSGIPLGTPSYMAPEQAQGDRRAIGPATDVYALGAILYELLTGRPPFRAETAAATLHQMLADDPAPPSRLNSRTPRDLETICLKCLDKDPHRRYATAAALADDLRRFERGEPIAARPAGRLKRAARWARRRPAAAALLAAGVLMFAGAVAGALWYVDQRARLGAEEDTHRAQVNGEANAGLDSVEEHLKDLRVQLDDPPRAWDLLSDMDRWHAMVMKAKQDFQRVKREAAVNEALMVAQTRVRIQEVDAAVDRDQAACDLAKELDDIAVNGLETTGSNGTQRAVAAYERFFSRQGLDIHQPGTAWFKSAVHASPVRFALIAALDNWAWLAGVNMVNQRMQFLLRDGVLDNKALLAAFTEDPQLARLLELTRAADPDPWRDRFRRPAVWADREALLKLAKEVDVGRQSPTVLVSLYYWLSLYGQDAAAMYARALLDHPRDFWMHLHAASVTREYGVRMGLALAARAIRPQSAMAYVNLAICLWERGDWSQAAIAAKRAIDINPNHAAAYYHLGVALRDLGDHRGAVAAFQKALALDPVDALERYLRAQVLQLQGRYTEAERAYLRIIEAYAYSANPAYDSLARLLATCPDDLVRDGKRAVKYATMACEGTKWKNPMWLDTLAAAYAETGQFEEAVRYESRALEDPTIRDDFRTAAKQRLELYRQKKPFRDQEP